MTAWVDSVGGFDSAVSTHDVEIAQVNEAAATLDVSPLGTHEQPTAPERSPLKLSSYVVEAGDTLSTIAAHFGINNDTLLWANELANPDLLPVGTKLIVPPMQGVLHRVRPGDTAADLASYYGSSLEKVIEVNALEPPYTILVDQRLLLPGGKMPILPAKPAPQAEEAAPGQPAQNDVQSPQETQALAAIVEAKPTPKPLPSPIGANAEQARFILAAAEAAQKSQQATGIPASVTIAQAILESFWGSSRLARENHNYFGIKAKERGGTAGVVWYDTWEVIGGANRTVREPFRAYSSMADSFVDHGRFFHQNGRYAAALAARDNPKQFAREINRAGYATDPAYSVKLIGLMDRFNLYAYDE